MIQQSIERSHIGPIFKHSLAFNDSINKNDSMTQITQKKNGVKFASLNSYHFTQRQITLSQTKRSQHFRVCLNWESIVSLSNSSIS